jgi:hypothetical protein
MENMERTIKSPRAGDGRKFASSLDEAGLADECERIEKCASDGSDYAYFAGWPQEQVAQLREYAAVVGLKSQMVPVHQAEEAKPSSVEDDADMKVLASLPAVQSKVSVDLSLAVGDPFHLTDISDAAKGKDDWERVIPERKLASQPSAEARSGSIMPLRGEYDYGTSQTLRVRPGENSVADPDAIGKLAKEEDTGARLKAEASQRDAERNASKTIWQQEAIQQAKAMGPGSLPRGTVILAADAAPKLPASGLDLKAAVSELGKSQTGEFELPDLTDGEKLHQSASERKTAIQRKAEKDDWQRVKGTTRPSLTDAFADALEFQLQRVAGVKQPVKTAGVGMLCPVCQKQAIPGKDQQPVCGNKICKNFGNPTDAADARGVPSPQNQPTLASTKPVEKVVTSSTAEQSDAFEAALEEGMKKIKKV